MLRLTNDGARITLQDQPTATGDGLFWFAFALLIGAIAVAMAMSVLPTRLAIGALALLIVGSFVFNWQRQQQKKQATDRIEAGELEVRAGSFTHLLAGQQSHLPLAEGDSIQVMNTELLITDINQQKKYHIVGFESEKEAKIMQAVLQGQQFAKRHANIKMQSS